MFGKVTLCVPQLMAKVSRVELDEFEVFGVCPGLC